MDFQWVSAHISGFNIGAPIEYAPHTKGHKGNP